MIKMAPCLLLVALMLATIGLAVSSSDQIAESANLRVTLLNQNPDPAQPGNYVEARFLVENLGSVKTGDLAFELIQEYPFMLDSGDTPMRRVGTLYARAIGTEGATLYYKLRIDPNAVEGDNTLRIRYSPDGGFSWVILDPFTLRIQATGAIVAITSTQTIPDRLEPGKTAQLKVKVQNYASSLMKDVTLKLDFTGSSTPFAPVGGSSEERIKSLAAGQSKEFTFGIITLGTAAASIYKVPLVMQYTDGTGNQYNKSDIVAVVVGAVPDIETTINSQTFYTAGATGTVTVKIVNKGVTDIKFLNVEVQPSSAFNLITSPTAYIGSISSDDYETIDLKMYVNPTKDASVVIPVRLEYRDANNEAYEKNEQLRLNLYSSGDVQKYGLNGGGTSYLLYVVILVLAGAGYFIYRRRKKR